MISRWKLARVIAAGWALVLGGCGKAVPEGQVLAIVNGDDVTMRDLAGAESAQNTADRALLGQVIDRRLLAEEARARGIDRSPEYLASLRALREQLLVQALGRELVSAQAQATAGEVAAYIAAHPHSFGERLLVDLATNPGAGPFTLDTLDLAPEEARRLADRKLGETFSYGGAVYTIVARHPSPLVGSDAQTYGQRAITATRLSDALQQLLREKRAKASILYMNGLGPAPN